MKLFNFGRRIKKNTGFKTVNECISSLIADFNKVKYENKMESPELTKFKSKLIQKVSSDGKVTNIDEIEEVSPLTAFFIKSDIIKEYNQSVFENFDNQKENIYCYNRVKNRLNYISASKMNKMEKEILIDGKNKVVEIIENEHSDEHLEIEYTTSRGDRLKVGINLFFGICYLK